MEYMGLILIMLPPIGALIVDYWTNGWYGVRVHISIYLFIFIYLFVGWLVTARGNQWIG